ncbi:unnamed protein product [marine sediment metagenome]|uniref:Ribbon-helix-helix protein CopG domain-containing protein n=1 Tax=marine sediment metagenome TaxID=412755 RepID=X1VKJ8_9ZZZZ
MEETIINLSLGKNQRVTYFIDGVLKKRIQDLAVKHNIRVSEVAEEMLKKAIVIYENQTGSKNIKKLNKEIVKS